MAQTREGALKIAASKAGVSSNEYEARMRQHLKWCSLCKQWHDKSEFGIDLSRWDGRVPSCKESKNELARMRYTPRARVGSGRSFIPARNGDKKQARRRVNFYVESGLLPHPNKMACSDCGHIWKPGERRHEYDHYLGYAAENHERVEPVCTRCHTKREMKRGTWGKRR